MLSDVGQRTTPTELPIFGDPYTEIALELVFPRGNPIFLLNGKTLQLLQPLDRDEENISHIVFQVRWDAVRVERNNDVSQKCLKIVSAQCSPLHNANIHFGSFHKYDFIMSYCIFSMPHHNHHLNITTIIDSHS